MMKAEWPTCLANSSFLYFGTFYPLFIVTPAAHSKLGLLNNTLHCKLRFA